MRACSSPRAAPAGLFSASPIRRLTLAACECDPWSVSHTGRSREPISPLRASWPLMLHRVGRRAFELYPSRPAGPALGAGDAWPTRTLHTRMALLPARVGAHAFGASWRGVACHSSPPPAAARGEVTKRV